MKKRYIRDVQATKLAGCTVSAAALMLGVSHAATVGFNFQANYCGAPSYSGAVVTAPAFGIGTNAWESLTPMATGYGNCTCGFTTLSEVIDTTTSTDGLHPLPQGSLTVTWGGYAANVSGFGGYSRPGPHYTFGGNNEQPGNEEVYWGFLRDGVNFGAIETNNCGYSSGDNYQPGYNVDITGLRSLFTNTPYVVQLIAASDSLWGLTNAFVIDATANTTQSVVYPSIPTPANAGGTLFDGTPFPRGIGGGLSTASGSFTTDHLKIIGNRAQHGAGFNLSSTIAGFIITDKPVISMSPNSVLASPADTISLSAYAVGVPPLAYQWRKNGQAIPGATTAAYSQINSVLAYAGNYDLVVTNLYGRATSSVAVVTVDHITAIPGNNFVVDSNPQNLEHDGLSFGATWVASNGSRSGLMNFSAAGSNQITVPFGSSFNSPTGTIMFWMRSSGVSNPAGNPATLVDRRHGNGSGCVIVQNTDGTLEFQADGGNDAFNSTLSVSDNSWHHVALTYDQTASGVVTIYIDGAVNAFNFNASAWTWQPGQEFELGFSNDPGRWQPYNGMLDDVRVYNRILSDAEVALAFTGSLVDNAALLLRLNFDAPPQTGFTLQWACPDAILQMAPNVTGPYTDLPTIVAPYPKAAQGSAKFFRYRGHTPSNVVSNPYLM